MRKNQKRLMTFFTFFVIFFMAALSAIKLRKYLPTTMMMTSTTTMTTAMQTTSSIIRSIINTSCDSTLSLEPITVTDYTSHFNSDQFVKLVKVWSLPSTKSTNDSTDNGYTTTTKNKEHQAICHLSMNGRAEWQMIPHFPHTMQILYRCWSWWQSNYPTKSPILWLLNNETQERLMGAKASEFNRGFMTSLEKFANVSIRLQENFSTVEQSPSHLPMQLSSQQQEHEQTADNGNNVTTIHNGNILQQASLVDDPGSRPYYYHIAQPFGSYPYQGETPVHFHALRDVILSGLGKNTSSTKKETMAEMLVPAVAESSFFPRIAILNREKSRKLLNAQEIAHEVELRLSLLWNKNVASPPASPPPTKKGEEQLMRPLPEQRPTIRIESFEGWSFEEQIQFMSTVDVLISPHGAQLTSIPFLPNCASVFEIFPKGYDVHYFFGSLAATSGVEHSYALLTLGNTTSEISEAMANYTTRSKSRGAQLCPSISDIVEMIVSVVERWRDRCSGGTVE